jgi:uncharacterized protein YndB with AHSA1/START domain
MELKFQVQAKIQKPRNEVFDAVVNPTKLSAYFTTGGASGPLVEGTEVIWKWSDYPVAAPVTVKKVLPNELLVLEWDAADHDPQAEGQQLPPAVYKTRVEMSFESLDAGSTLVKISEGLWKETQKGLNASYDNCGGWMQMACCLKAWLEHGINLRQGFF